MKKQPEKTERKVLEIESKEEDCVYVNFGDIFTK